jgi:hypothetical protein
MSFELNVVTDEKDFDEIVRVLYAAFSEPPTDFLKWYIPIHTTVDDATEAFKGRAIDSWKEDPQCYWLKVTDTETGKILGAACWEVHDANKVQENAKVFSQPYNADWHMDGSEEKAFANILFEGMDKFMAEKMTRPHVGKKLLRLIRVSFLPPVHA